MIGECDVDHAGKNGARAGWRLAAPSWVFPGTIRDNCAFLAGKVDEAALLFLQTEPSRAYGRQDLPPDLARLGLSFHVHLPLDLPWHAGGEAVAAVCLELMDMVSFLDARRCVLHPPPAGSGGDAAALEAFSRQWLAAGRSPCDVLLENTRGNDLTGLWTCIETIGLGLCLDLGHMLAYGQRTLGVEFPERARPRMLHLNAPGGPGSGAHLPLDTLDAAGAQLGARLCAHLAADGVVVAEFFDWGYIERSLPIITRWCAGVGR